MDRKTFKDIYYSNEFFKDTSESDLEAAIKDIGTSYVNNDLKYQFYKFDTSRIPIKQTYTRTQDYDPRPNQKETIVNFKQALKKRKKKSFNVCCNVFGKSFTSMCCALK